MRLHDLVFEVQSNHKTNIMKILDFFRSKKLDKIPLNSKRSALSFFSGGSSNAMVANYYTSWVYLAVSIIAQEVAGIQLKLFKEDSKGNVEQVFKHPALDLIAQSNNFMTQYDVFERLQSNLELQGNEYWFLGLAKEPSVILPLSPPQVTPVPDQYEYVKEYVYKVDGATYTIPKENIVHFKQFNPKSDIVGMSTLEAAKTAADTDNFSRAYNKKYFQNNARPDIILKYPETLQPDDEKRLLDAWQQNHGGPEKQFRTAVASGGLEISSFQISQRDMEFLEGRKFNRDEIMAIFRVPLAIAGFTGNETYASAKAAAYAFGTRTITPKMKRIVNSLNEFYLPLFNNSEGLYFDFVSPVLEDRDMILREYDMGIRGGWLSINDVRREEDLPEIQSGESVYIPFNVQPLGEPVESKKYEKPVSKLVKEISNAFMKALPEEEPEDTRTEKEKQFEAKGEYIVKQRDERGLAYEDQFKKVLNQLWDEQKQNAINNLKASLKTKEWRTKAVNLLDKEKEVKATIDLFTPLMLGLLTDEGEAAAAFLGSGEFTITPKLRKFLESNTKKFAGEITDETSSKLRSSIAAGLEAGEAIQDLEKRIMNSTAFDLPRAEKIARTETIRAQTKSEIEVWKESGVVNAKIWYTAQDERTCPLCAPMHEKVISLNDTFFAKGDSHEGEDGAVIKLDYEAVDGPPLHPNCRCTLIPVIE